MTGGDIEPSVPRTLEVLVKVSGALATLPRNDQSEQLLIEAPGGKPLDLAALVGELLDKDLPLPVDLVHGALARWLDGGQEIWEWISKWCISSMLVEDATYWPLSGAIWEVLDSLAAIPERAEPGQVAAQLSALAEELERLDEIEAAMPCAFAALNFVGAAEDPAVVPLADVALRLALAAGDRDRIVFAQLRRALALAPRYATDESVRHEAVDALETVVRHLGVSAAVAPALEHVERWLRAIPQLRPLALVALATHPEDGPVPAADLAPLALAVRPCWELEPENLGQVPLVLQPWMEFENLRLALEGASLKEAAAEASWDTWSIDHPAFRRAVPHGPSILRELDLDELLLVLQHEATHVLSMLSGVGLVVTGLRAAVLDAEFDLWTGGPRVAAWEEVDAEIWAVPPAGAPLALAQGEQLLELRRKLQILQSIWGPLLEGIAIYGELCADPREEDEQASHVANLVANLVDTDIVGQAEEAGVAPDEMTRRTIADAESRYGAALDREGSRRLRVYLDRRPEKYLAGYVAVRSVVSAWRACLAEDLSGVAAFRILLHSLRATSSVAAPPLDGPLDGFADRALNGMMRWLDSVAQIGADQLPLLAANRAVLCPTEDGLLTIVSTNEAFEGVEVEVARRFAEARHALEGDATDTHRVPDVDAEFREMLAGMANSLALGSTKPSRAAQAFIEHALTAPELMPVARTSAPFWLNRPTHSLVCILRTTEEDYEHGKSSYQVCLFPLGEESFCELERAMRTRAGTRLEVTRFADLVDRYDPDVGRLPGINYLAFSFDDWLEVTPRGWWLTKTTSPEAIEKLAARRLAPHPAVDLEQRMGQDDGALSASRIRDWLDSTDRWTEAGVEYPLEPWAHHVRQLADDVVAVAPGNGDSPADRALLTWVLGDVELGTRLAARGLKDLYSVSGDSVPGLVRALHSSNRRPVADVWLDDHAEDLHAAIGPLMRRAANGWDVTPPRATRKEAKQ